MLHASTIKPLDVETIVHEAGRGGRRPDLGGGRLARLLVIGAVADDRLEAEAGGLGHIGHADLGGRGEVVRDVPEVGHDLCSASLYSTRWTLTSRWLAMVI